MTPANDLGAGCEADPGTDREPGSVRRDTIGTPRAEDTTARPARPATAEAPPATGEALPDRGEANGPAVRNPVATADTDPARAPNAERTPTKVGSSLRLIRTDRRAKMGATEAVAGAELGAEATAGTAPAARRCNG